MRISDWSSDVCSSDLLTPPRRRDIDEDPRGKTGRDLEGQRIFRAADREAARMVLRIDAERISLAQTRNCGDRAGQEIGRATCRERVGQYVSNSGVPV